MKNIFKIFTGRKRFLHLFQSLLDISLKGLNYENNADFRENGELWVLDYLRKKYKGEQQVVLFDVEGDVGDYAKVLSEVFGKQAYIYTFEPSQSSTIDVFCGNNRIEQIHFLRLDMEGQELSALQGAKKMLSKGNVGHIQFKFGDCNLDSGTYFRDFYCLFHSGYRIYRILKDGLNEIGFYKESLEIFRTARYLAVRKDLAVSV